jgi:hypothetical protein
VVIFKKNNQLSVLSIYVVVHARKYVIQYAGVSKSGFPNLGSNRYWKLKKLRS